MAVLAACLSVSIAACAGIPTKGDVPLAKVDLQRMYGGWYIVAVMPNVLERGLVGSYDVFSPGKRAGAIHEDYYMQRGGFDGKKNHFSGDVIRVLPDSGNADWRVSPVLPVSLPFQIVYVDPAYRFVLFGEQDRKWGWIYSRTQTISDADYADLLGRFRALGWDTAPFRRTVQLPEQIGAPGFWSDGVKRP
jgi:apolipoprotein D and lipocalin family protein